MLSPWQSCSDLWMVGKAAPGASFLVLGVFFQSLRESERERCFPHLLTSSQVTTYLTIGWVAGEGDTGSGCPWGLATVFKAVRACSVPFTNLSSSLSVPYCLRGQSRGLRLGLGDSVYCTNNPSSGSSAPSPPQAPLQAGFLHQLWLQCCATSSLGVLHEMGEL